MYCEVFDPELDIELEIFGVSYNVGLGLGHSSPTSGATTKGEVWH